MFPKVLLFRPVGLLSKFISWQTDSDYSHAALMFDDCVIEAVQFKGVHKLAHDQIDWSRVDVYQVAGMTEEAAKAIREFAESQVGSGYDYWGVLRFISRRRLPDNEDYFCSEFVFDAVRNAGINLLERIESYQVDPGQLRTSPLLILEGGINS
jgi:uncharacterized protein YycO